MAGGHEPVAGLRGQPRVRLLPELPATSSHNLWLDIGIEGGAVALAGAFFLTWAQFRAFTAALLRRTDDGLSLALTLGVLSFTLFGMFFNSLLYFSGLMVWLAFWWWFPIIAESLRTSSGNRFRQQ